MPSERGPLRGDEQDLFRRHHRALYRIVRARIGGCPDELVEDACAVAWMQLCATQPERDNVLGWLVTVARRAALRMLAAQAGTVDDGLEAAGRVADGSVEHDAELASEAQGALDGLARLRPAQRDTLALMAAGYSYKEIQVLCGGKTYTWVNRHITEARAALRKASA